MCLSLYEIGLTNTMSEHEIHINQNELHQYSRTLANRMADYYFIDHSFIEGKDILKFCDIKQVNLFLVKNLFEKWQGETAKLESPYFDFNNPAVKQALQQFMNTLSQHIRVMRDDFHPILSESIREALLLVVEPLSFFRHEINKVIYQPPSEKKYKEISKYISINKKIWAAFLSRVQGVSALNKEQANQILDEVMDEYRTGVEPMQWVLQSFSDIMHLDIAKLLGQEEKQNQLPSIATEKTILIEDAATLPPHPISEAERNSFEISRPKLIQDEPREDSEQAGTLNAAFKTQKQNANLAERFQKAKVQNIRSAITLNQKFQYTKQLFGGDSLAFSDALDKLEQTQSYEEVKHLLQYEYGHRYGWDFEQEDTRSFMELVERKFS